MMIKTKLPVCILTVQISSYDFVCDILIKC